LFIKKSEGKNISNKNLIMTKEKLNPYWISGYVDSEGSFIFSINKDKRTKFGLSFRARFQIGVHESDKFILYRIKEYFNDVGSVRKNKSYYYYIVDNVKDIDTVIIPHFEIYPLLTFNKFRSFYLLKECIKITKATKSIQENKNKNIGKKIGFWNYNLTKEEFVKLLSYKATFKLGFKAKIFDNVDKTLNLETITIPYSSNLAINPYWLAGFVAGDGSFGCYKRGDKYKNYYCSFRISQNVIDISLLVLIQKYLKCGKVFKFKNGMCDLSVYAIEDLNKVIVPFFINYKLETSKEKDFICFQEILNVFNKKGFRTEWKKEDLQIIKDLILSMNNYRRKI